MKADTIRNILFIGLVAILAGLVLSLWESRSSDQGRPSINMTEEKKTTLSDWEKQYPGIKKYVFESRPTSLPAYLKHPGFTVNNEFRFPEKGWIVGFEPEVVGATKETLHHVDLIAAGYPDFCKYRMPNVILASGKELNTGFSPLGYGFPIPSGNVVSHIMYHNDDPIPLQNVRLRLVFWYVPQQYGPLKPEKALDLDVVGVCKWGDYYVGPKTKATSTLTPAYIVEQSGKVLIIGPHVHDYAKEFEIILNGKSIKKLRFNKKIGDIPILRPKDLHVRKGDKLQISVTYDNSTDQEINAMGEAMFFITPE